MKSATDKATKLCKKVGNPSGSAAETLVKLFGSSSRGSRKRSFDPRSECVVASQQAKKKATNQRMKPKSVTVVLLDQKPSTVPKGHSRKKLKKAGRIARIQLMRCMTVAEVRDAVVDNFTDFENIKSFQFLRCGKDNIMLLNEEQDLNGDATIDLAGQGSLYLVQRKVEVRTIMVYGRVGTKEGDSQGGHGLPILNMGVEQMEHYALKYASLVLIPLGTNSCGAPILQCLPPNVIRIQCIIISYVTFIAY